MVTQVRRHPLAEQAADLLLARIRAGEWPLGHKLPGETTLAAQLGVGRSTLREAIRVLAGKGVLASRQGAGVFVTALDIPEEWDIVLRRATIAAVLEARIAIEAEAAALAALRRTPADLRAIRRALSARADQGTPPARAGQGTPPARATENRTIAGLVDADTAFHRAVLVAAHNDILTQLFDTFLPRSRAAMIDMLQIRPMAAPDEDHAAHERLAEAIAARDAAAAATYSRAHLQTIKEAFV